MLLPATSPVKGATKQQQATGKGKPPRDRTLGRAPPAYDSTGAAASASYVRPNVHVATGRTGSQNKCKLNVLLLNNEKPKLLLLINVGTSILNTWSILDNIDRGKTFDHIWPRFENL